MQPTGTTDQLMPKIESSIRDALALSHPGVVFTDLWLKPRTSWCGSDMVDVWAVYEGGIADLAAAADVSLRVLQSAVEAEFARSHGRIAGGELAIVALGKLGGREMTPTSDLDLVFVAQLHLVAGKVRRAI